MAPLNNGVWCDAQSTTKTIEKCIWATCNSSMVIISIAHCPRVLWPETTFHSHSLTIRIVFEKFIVICIQTLRQATHKSGGGFVSLRRCFALELKKKSCTFYQHQLEEKWSKTYIQHTCIQRNTRIAHCTPHTTCEQTQKLRIYTENIWRKDRRKKKLFLLTSK